MHLAFISTLLIAKAIDHTTRRDAPAPFNNSRADIIVRSCDRVDYRVRSSILAEASSVFEDMFDIAREAPVEQCPRRDGIPVVPVTETSEVVDLLLRLCYPVAAPVFTTFSQVRDVLTAVDKYLMEGLTETMKKHLTDFTLDGAHPLLVYVTAYAHHFEDVARIAAQRAVGQPLQDVYFTELEELTAGAYYRLLQFHNAGDPEALPSLPFLYAELPQASARTPLKSYDRKEWEAKYAESPYPFGLPSADLTLRARDGVEFKVHSDLLRVASPYFLLTLTSGSQSINGCERSADGRVVGLTLPEHSRTIAAILQYIYPVARPDALPDPQTASLLLQAAKKYELVAAIEPLQTLFLAFAETRPLMVYAIACAHHWVREARHAALMSMRTPLDDCYVEELEAIPASCYYHLLQHRKAMGTLAEALALDQMHQCKAERVPSMPDEKLVWVSCTGCPAYTLPRAFYNPFGLRKWWCEWLQQAAQLLGSVPCGKTVLDQQTMRCALKSAATCKTCGPTAAFHLQHFSQILSAKVDAMLLDETSQLMVF
ncbi:uncharacterized protein B0H18DRAFT_306440 [Fomitopsis serialis]|uniref:uncharacterized protein n=1 Tax=Fomitopsis serialis TaxID=139415 RepID=UPI0020072A8E|nr:uncharacterized protein B0H18DRAFT_306440 [Neoantrodia serialis]KAH9927004.1 hypothetical protein B0H18DRAFT_306440 [Neoantrodia serialis]